MTAAETTAPVGQTLSNRPSVKAAVVIAAFLGTIAFCIGGFVLFSRRGPSAHADAQTIASAPVAASPPVATAAPPPPPLSTEAPKDVPPPPPPEAPAASTASVSSSPAASKPPPVAPSAVQHGPPKPKATAPTAPNAASKSCDPPYYYDANRNRVFKKECM
jgi:hypothetical protein